MGLPPSCQRSSLTRDGPVQSVYRTPNLPQSGRQVLGAALNCSQSPERPGRRQVGPAATSTASTLMPETRQLTALRAFEPLLEHELRERAALAREQLADVYRRDGVAD